MARDGDDFFVIKKVGVIGLEIVALACLTPSSFQSKKDR